MSKEATCYFLAYHIAMSSSVLIAIPAKLIFAFCAAHMLTASIFINIDFALWTWFSEELHVEICFQIAPKIKGFLFRLSSHFAFITLIVI